MLARAFLLLLGVPGLAYAAPLTDPDDPRSWQGASVETFRTAFGLATRQDVIDLGLLEDGAFPTYADTSPFNVAGSACGAGTSEIVTGLYIGAVQGCSGYSTTR